MPWFSSPRTAAPARRLCLRALVVALVGSGALDVANATRMERSGAGRRCRSSDGSIRCLGGRARGSVVSGGSPRLPPRVYRGGGSRERPENGEKKARSKARSNLIETYRHQGARYFADLGSRADDPRRKGLHDFVRQRYKVIVDRPEVIIADLADSEMHWNAN